MGTTCSVHNDARESGSDVSTASEDSCSVTSLDAILGNVPGRPLPTRDSCADHGSTTEGVSDLDDLSSLAMSAYTRGGAGARRSAPGRLSMMSFRSHQLAQRGEAAEGTPLDLQAKASRRRISSVVGAGLASYGRPEQHNAEPPAEAVMKLLIRRRLSTNVADDDDEHNNTNRDTFGRDPCSEEWWAGLEQQVAQAASDRSSLSASTQREREESGQDGGVPVVDRSTSTDNKVESTDCEMDLIPLTTRPLALPPSNCETEGEERSAGQQASHREVSTQGSHSLILLSNATNNNSHSCSNVNSHDVGLSRGGSERSQSNALVASPPAQGDVVVWA